MTMPDRGPPSRPEPIFSAPAPLLALIALLLGIHAYRSFVLGLFEGADIPLLDRFAFVPARFALMAGLIDEAAIRDAIAAGAPDLQAFRGALFDIFVADGEAQPWSLVTYAFLHGSWEHAIVNSLWMLAFGSPVMERFGLWRFLLFFAATAAAGALLQALLNPTEVSALIGASGAVSGLTAAALRFAIGPGLMGPGRLSRLRPAAPLAIALRDRNVLIFIAVWFGINLVAGLGAPFGGEGLRIAWEAHVGGFAAGLLLFSLFDPIRS
jgi:membrane associated rhomboid family serine protease